MRKALIILISIAFTGALLVYTAQANLNLLTTVYPNPQFVGFGMLALEGGVVYWEGYYLLHWNGSHKGIAVFMCGLDFVISMIGFFMDINLQAGNAIHTDLFPPVIILISADVCINVGMGLLVHYLPDGAQQGKSQNHAQPAYQIHEQRGETNRQLPQPQRTEAQLEAELRNNSMYAAWFNWLETQRGESARPLASNQPKEDPIELDSQATIEPPQIEQPKVRELKSLPPMRKPQKTSQQVSQNPERGMLSEGVSTLTQKLSGYIRHGKTAAHAPGKTSQTTDENM